MQAASGLRTLARRLAGGVPRRLLVATMTTPQQHQQLRKMTTQLKPREQKLLEEDPALKAFKSDKAKIQLIKRIGDVLVIAVVAGTAYEIYYRVMERKAAHAEESVKEE
ncbi:unnamed protein product [Calypogeia fissa]